MKTNYEKLMKINYEKLLIFYLPFTEADLCCFSVFTGLWSHVIQVFGSNRHLKPCHPRGGRRSGMGSMASRAVTERFLLLCSASHRLTTSNAKHFPPSHMPLLE